jgi:hypothetical protein
MPEPTERQQQAFVLVFLVQCLLFLAVATSREPYHTSRLSGEDWVIELLQGHPRRIYHELGVNKGVFRSLLAWLRTHGHKDSRHVSLHEQLAIFLYMCRTGLSTQHVGERFQRSIETVSRLLSFQIHLI